jgi:predicted DNA-binding mobile mystery protein A
LILETQFTMANRRFDNLRIAQLDRALEDFRGLRHRPPPKAGWVRAVREALGMSLRQLAGRAGIAKTTVRMTELNEAGGTVQLDSLRRLADALECDLVYALIPRSSLQATRRERAKEIAADLVGRVSSSMELEDQGVPEAQRQRQIEELTTEILERRSRDLWDG